MTAARIHLNHAHAWLYRHSGGRFGATMGGHEILLLSTTGRRTGVSRTTPVQYQRLDGKLVLVAANHGSPRAPGWWFNLEAQPTVDVQIGSESTTLRASTATGDERRALWPRVVEGDGSLTEVEQRAGRELPLVVLAA